MLACNKCRTGLRASGDSWCWGCRALESAQLELGRRWSNQGARALAEEILLSAVRQVRALGALGPTLLAGEEPANLLSVPAGSTPRVVAGPVNPPPLRAESAAAPATSGVAVLAATRARKEEEVNPRAKRHRPIKEEDEYTYTSEEEVVDPKQRSNPAAGISSKAPLATPRGGYHSERDLRHKKKKKDKTHRSGRKHQRHQKSGPERVVHRRLEAHHLDHPSRRDFRPLPVCAMTEDFHSAPYGDEEVVEPVWEEEELSLQFSFETPGTWAALELTPGGIVEIPLEVTGEGCPNPVAALLIMEKLGERSYSVKYVGTNDKEDRLRHKELGKDFNQRGATLHLCLTGERLCEVDRENPLVRHVEKLTYWPPHSFPAAYCTAHGKRALKTFMEKIESGTSSPIPALPLTGKSRVASNSSPNPLVEKPSGHMGGDFFSGLEAMKARVGNAGPSILRRTVSWADKDSAVESRRGEVPALTPRLALPALPGGPVSIPVKAEQILVEDSGSESRRRSKKSGKGGRLFARARAQEAAEAGVPNKRRGRSESRKSRRKSKKRRRRSSSSSGSGKSSSIESRSSYEKELIPPVRRKAEKKPGAVFEELLTHIRKQLSEREQGLGRELHAEMTGETEVKVSLFFQLFWRSRFETRPRDQRELYLLARCMDP